MTKERKAQVLTIAVLGIAIFVAVAARSGWKFSLPAAATRARTEPSPQDAVYGMLDAARDGNVSRYLSYYSAQMLLSLQQSLAESGEPGFAKYLRDSNAAIKGVAINEPQPLTDREVRLRVEYVYQDRNEVQQMYLEKASNGWKIARVDSAERIKTLVPYGTPVQ